MIDVKGVAVLAKASRKLGAVVVRRVVRRQSSRVLYEEKSWARVKSVKAGPWPGGPGPTGMIGQGNVEANRIDSSQHLPIVLHVT